jgi:hypothetical protein
MGLRIIDRQYRVRNDVSDVEHRVSLEQSTRRWLAAKGDDTSLSEREFLDKFELARHRMQTPTSMVEMAARVRAGISRQQDGGPHQQVDIATLLQLL